MRKFVLLRFAIFLVCISQTYGGLLHRYNFDGTGVICMDQVNGQNGEIKNGAQLDGSGSIKLDGINDYIELPAGILSKLDNVTIETWLTWEDTQQREWQNVFYFGNNQSHWMFLSPNSQGAARFAIASNSAEIRANAESAFPVNSANPLYLAVTVEDASHTVKVYLDGDLLSESSRVPPISQLDDTANSIGKPIFTGFPTFRGTFYEFRIHDIVYTPAKILLSQAGGPDKPLGPEVHAFTASESVVRSGTSVTLNWEASDGSVVDIQPDVVTGASETGSVSVVVEETTTYTLRATDEDGLRIAEVEVEIDDRPVIKDFTIDTSGVEKVGDLITLAWDVNFAEFIEITPSTPQILGSNGSLEIPLRATTSFTLLARNRHGSRSLEVQAILPEKGLLKITEFLADNNEVLLDDHGEESDWIEIHNIGNKVMDLSRWSLSDDSDNLGKWTFPDGATLAAHARMIVFASGRGVPGPEGAYHLNFRLSDSSGSYLALTRDDGIVGSLYADLPKQDENQSMGLLEEGSLPDGGIAGDFALFTNPTPGEPNMGGYLGQVKDTKFSLDRGFYTRSFLLEITSKTDGAEIYYTSNGTDPSPTNGSRYTGPIRIGKTTCLRAAAFKSGMLPSNIDTHSYLFLHDVIRQSPYGTPPAGWPTTNIKNQYISYGMDPDIVSGVHTAGEVVDALKAISSLSITIDLDHLFDANTGIYTNARNDGRAWERPASMELLNPDGTEGFQSGIGLRIRGGYSRSSSNPKHSFRVFFRRDYGNGNLNYPMFEDEGIDEFDKFDLRTAQNFSWAFGGPGKNTMVREVFSRDTQGEMGHPYTRSRYYHLYINGQYWGIYMTQERVGSTYCSNYFGGEKEDYDILKAGDGKVMIASAGKMDDYNLFHAQAVAGFKEDANYYRAQGLNPDGTTPNPEYRKYLDVNNLADYMTITYWTGDRDSAGSKFTRPRPNNFYGWLNRKEPDGFKFMEHDSEHSLGANENDMVNPLLTNDSRTWDQRYFNAHWLHERLTENAEYRMQFADRVYKHLYNDGVLTVENALEKLEKRVQQIDKAIIAESARWGDQKTHPPMARSHWLANVEQVRGWIRQRTPTVISQIRAHDWYPDIHPPELSQAGGQVQAADTISMSQISGKAYYTLDGSDPRLPGGAIRSTSVEYTTPFTLPNSQTTLKVRSLQNGEWSPLRENAFIVGAQPATPETLAISEIHYNPSSPTSAELAQIPELESSDFEFIEVTNVGTEPINLMDARFFDGVTFTFPDLTLDPSARTLVVNNRAAFVLRYGNTQSIAGEYEGSLRNSGEIIILQDQAGNTAAYVDYKDGGDWPGRADGKGSSMEIVDVSASAEDPGNWRSSSEFGGTPGSAGLGADNRIVINEVLTHTDPPLKDSIELLNTTSQTINIGGWYLSDSAEDFKKYQFPANQTISPNAYLVIDESQFNPDPTNPDANGFALSSSKGDSVWLMEADQDGKLVRFVDHVEFDAARNAEPFGRWPNATGKLYPLSQHTPGATNAAPRVGPLLVTEVHYNPRSKNPEHQFIEIANLSTEYVPMANWKLRGGVDYDFPGWAVLPPNGLLLLVNFSPDDPYKLEDFRTQYPLLPEKAPMLGPWEDGDLELDAHNIRLLRPDDLLALPGETPFYPMVIEEEFQYFGQAPWPTTPITNNHSIHRRSLTNWAFEATHWQSLEPTPGLHANLYGDDTDSDGMSDIWETRVFGHLNNLPTADSDLDTLPNLLEYAMGSDPADPVSGIQFSTSLDAEDHLTLTYRRLTIHPGIHYQIQIADKLGNWVAADDLTEIISAVQDGDYTTLTVRDKSPVSANPSRFLRVLIETY